MFDNIGEKIKTLASIICWIMIAVSVLAGIAIAKAADSLILFFLVAAVGSLLAWVGSFLLYGIGQLIDDNSQMRSMMRDLVSAAKATAKNTSEHASEMPRAAAPAAVDPAPAAAPEAAYGEAPGYPEAYSEQPWQRVQEYYVVPEEIGNDLIRCPNCGSVQKTDRTSCYRCGTRFGI